MKQKAGAERQREGREELRAGLQHEEPPAPWVPRVIQNREFLLGSGLPRGLTQLQFLFLGFGFFFLPFMKSHLPYFYLSMRMVSPCYVNTRKNLCLYTHTTSDTKCVDFPH